MTPTRIAPMMALHMWEWRTGWGWADVALWLLLAVIVLWLFMGAWWPTRQGNGE
jgi:hypothetical protein